MPGNVNRPSSLLTVPVTNELSFAFFKTIFANEITALFALLFTMPDKVTVVVCAWLTEIVNSIK